MGGEKTVTTKGVFRMKGSPPRGWGKVEALLENPNVSGITRVGGEKIQYVDGPVSVQGSPPRGRGKGEPTDLKAYTRGSPRGRGKVFHVHQCE